MKDQYHCRACKTQFDDGFVLKGRLLCYTCYHTGRRCDGFVQGSLFEEPGDDLLHLSEFHCLDCGRKQIEHRPEGWWCKFCDKAKDSNKLTLGVELSPPIEGWIYVMTNPAMPGLVKIGRSEWHPAERRAQLSRPTGIPVEFELRESCLTSHYVEAEQAIHAKLRRFRVRRRREFFAVPVDQAIAVVEAICAQVDVIYKKP